jgi:hypothetical protein
MAVATETRTDTQIQSDVLAELKWDARLMPNEIGVAVKDGGVTLTGWVDSYTKKWAAEKSAHRATNRRDRSRSFVYRYVAVAPRQKVSQPCTSVGKFTDS